MRQPIAVTVAQPRVTPGDVRSTALEHAAMIRRAPRGVVAFPELSLTGYELDAPPIAPDAPVLAPIVQACAETRSVAFVGAPIEEDGGRYIAALRVEGTGASVAYRKSHLGGDELRRCTPGDGPTAVMAHDWRFGLGICKDTGVAAHTEATAQLDVDVYLAGLVHRPEELGEQDARGMRIAAGCSAYVAFASFAGPTGGGYDTTAGRSTIWSPAGDVLARATDAAGALATAILEPAPGRVPRQPPRR